MTSMVKLSDEAAEVDKDELSLVTGEAAKLLFKTADILLFLS